ncbi:TonB-dependent receptor [Proteobacteria bacterium 005FR1]|nr:TonB-dependent receptor [Proteobacteria bacterium 005FR1]
MAASAQTDQIDEIVTTAQRRDAQFDVAGNIAQLGKEELDRISHLHIQDALVRVPGVSFHQGNGQEYLPSIRSAVLTGAGACGSFLTAQDGIPLRAAGFCNVNELFEAYTEQAQRIEVIRGPSNALYGSNALHGVINVIMPSAPEQTESAIGLELGANDYRREELYYGTTSGRHGFVVNATATHDGGFRDDAYYDQQKIQLRHELTLDSWNIATTLAATNLNQETAGYIEGFEVYKDDDLIETNPNPEAYRDARSLRLYSRMEKRVSDTESLVITPYFRKTEMEFMQHFLPRTPLEENGQDSLGLMLTYYNDVTSDFQWIAGLDVEATDGWLRETQEAPTMGPFPTGLHYDYQVDALQVAPFAQLNWAFADRWHLTAGLRLETMRYDYDNKMLAGNSQADGSACPPGTCRYSRPADREDEFDNLSPQVGILYELADNHRLFFNIANGFRAPQATELYRLQQNQTVADLDSEEIVSFEIGARGASDALSYQVSLYSMVKENLIFRDSRQRNNLGDGETEHLGLELAVDYRFADNWKAGLVANFADHEYASEQSLGESIKGNQEDTAPKHFGTAHLGWNFLPGAYAELELVHMGSYYVEPTNQHAYDGHDLLNLRTQWQVSEQVELQLNVLNLTDESYADRADWNGFADTFRYFPGEPRSAYVAVNLRF